MQSMIVHQNSKEQLNLLEQLVKALNIPFEKQEDEGLRPIKL